MDPLDIDDRGEEIGRRRPRTGSFFTIVLRICAFVVLGTVLLAATVYVPRGYRLANAVIRPYAKLYATKGEDSVIPLFGADTEFDVVVTVWRRRKCTGDKEDCEANHWGNSRRPRQIGGRWVAEYAPPQVDEEVVFSAVVDQFGLQGRDHEVEFEFELPAYAKIALDTAHEDWPSNYDVRAAVSLVPRGQSLLDHISHYTASTPEGMIVPPVVDNSQLPTSVDWGAEGSIRRKTITDRLTVHIPLLHLRPNTKTYILEHHIVNKTHVFMMDETHPMSKSRWLAKFNNLKASKWCGQEVGWGDYRPFPNGTWQLCPGALWNNQRYFYYGSRGHFLGMFEVDGSGDPGFDTQLAYNPFFERVPGDTGPLDHTLVSTTDGDEPAAPLKVRVGLRLSVLNAKKEQMHLARQKLVSEGDIHYSNPERTLQTHHDMWTLTNGLLGSPDERAHTWRRLFFVGTHKLLGMIVALLTVTYWYTRRTAAGISHASIWMRTLVVVPKNIHWLVTGFVFRYGSYGFFNTLGFIFVLVLMCLGEIFQLRLVAPFDVRGHGWGFDPRGTTAEKEHSVMDGRHTLRVDANLKLVLRWPGRKWTQRERETMRLEPLWPTVLGTLLTFAACMAFFYLSSGYIIPPKLPINAWDDPSTQDFLAKTVKAIGWAGYATANLLQVRMNYAARSFAGTYALVAYLQVGIEACKFLYHLPAVMGHYYVPKGLSVFEASQVLFAGVVAYQAATLPKIPQREEIE